jgi:cell division septum initiation protein DivIVA
VKGGLFLENRISNMLEQLDELVDRGAKVPLTNKVMIDADTFQNILDELRRSVPEEVKHARIIMEDKDRILHEARSEAKELVERAQRQADNLLNEDEIARKGRAQAEEMVGQAQQYYLEMKRGVLVYSNEVLQKLEENLGILLRQVQGNRGDLASQAQSRDLN